MASTTRAPRPGFRPHDHVTEFQVCDACGLRLGACIETEHDALYYGGRHDVGRCPVDGCDGIMALPAGRFWITEEHLGQEATREQAEGVAETLRDEGWDVEVGIGPRWGSDDTARAFEDAVGRALKAL